MTRQLTNLSLGSPTIPKPLPQGLGAAGSLCRALGIAGAAVSFGLAGVSTSLAAVPAGLATTALAVVGHLVRKRHDERLGEIAKAKLVDGHEFAPAETLRGYVRRWDAMVRPEGVEIVVALGRYLGKNAAAYPAIVGEFVREVLPEVLKHADLVRRIGPGALTDFAQRHPGHADQITEALYRLAE